MGMILPDHYELVDGKRVCPYNKEVFCPIQVQCGSCGWFPRNDELRQKRVREVLRKRDGV